MRWHHPPVLRFPTPARAVSRAGASLIELLTVLAIFATLAGITVPRFSAAAKVSRVKAAAQRLAEELRGARDAAWRWSTSVEVRFDVGSGRVEWSALSGGFADQETQTDLGAEPYRVRVASVTGGGELTFDGYGNPDRAISAVVRGADLIVTVSVSLDGSVTLSGPSRMGMGG